MPEESEAIRSVCFTAYIWSELAEGLREDGHWEFGNWVAAFVEGERSWEPVRVPLNPTQYTQLWEIVKRLGYAEEEG